MMLPQPRAVQRLPQTLGSGAALVLGLASMLGSGLFAGLALAGSLAGPWLFFANLLAAGLAMCNGLSSAALAALHPQSGGSYEYGYRWLSPLAGFTAGWTFLLAKSASAAAAALTCAAYLLHLLGAAPQWQRPLALLLLLSAVVFTLGGLHRSLAVTCAMLGLTLLALLAYCAAAMPESLPGLRQLWPELVQLAPPAAWPALLQAAALLFVAYTGFGRIATLGEEVAHPRRSIPRAIVLSILLCATIYSLIALTTVTALGATTWADLGGQSGAPLVAAARALGLGWVSTLLAVGAVSAVYGVMLNLLLGLSRVALAMARRGDLPRGLAELDAQATAPRAASLFCAVPVALLTGLAAFRSTWELSACAVLIYYSLTNLAALRLEPQQRMAPRWAAWLGLLACLALACCIPWQTLAWSAGLILLGWAWHGMQVRHGNVSAYIAEV